MGCIGYLGHLPHPTLQGGIAAWRSWASGSGPHAILSETTQYGKSIDRQENTPDRFLNREKW